MFGRQKPTQTGQQKEIMETWLTVKAGRLPLQTPAIAQCIRGFGLVQEIVVVVCYKQVTLGTGDCCKSIKQVSAKLFAWVFGFPRPFSPASYSSFLSLN